LGEALRFLTVLPVPGLPPASERGLAQAIAWFPAAGVILGLLLLPVGWLAGLWEDGLVRAALIIVAWGALTAGLHLDGLSDTFDAVISWRSRERKLEIMKDSRIGAMGAIALIAVLLLKVAFLAQAGEQWWVAVLLAPLLGRWTVIYGIVRFPAAREGGLGREFKHYVQQRDLLLATVAMLVLCGLTGGLGGLLAVALVWGTAHVIAVWWTRDLGGLTGDTYGALCEIGEVVALAVLTL
jgi:adenosylcobinamide-GDP ribazoletransferase